jgi:hypothetical protein
MELIALVTLAIVAWGLFVANLVQDLVDPDDNGIVRASAELNDGAAVH